MTEMVTGVDLIAEQIRAAQGEVLRYKQEDIQLKVRQSSTENGTTLSTTWQSSPLIYQLQFEWIEQ